LKLKTGTGSGKALYFFSDSGEDYGDWL